MSFGASLKRERELRGITLDEISRATKISVRLLGAIESDRFDILPEAVFRKSFIRSYAKYLGMNEEQVLQEYALEVQEDVAQPAPEVKPAPLQGAAPARRLWPVVIILVFGFAAAGIGYWYRREFGSSAEPLPSAAQVQPVRAADPPSNAARGTVGGVVSPPDRQGEPALKVLGELAKKPEKRPRGAAQEVGLARGSPPELVVEATAESWLSVKTGETVLYSGIMKPAESQKFPLQSPLELVLGNAAGVRITINGQDFASIGKSGERKTLEVSAENYQQFLARKTP